MSFFSDPFHNLLYAVTSCLTLASSGLAYELYRRRREINKKNEELSRHLFELSLLVELSDKLGYSLNIETVAEIILDETSKLLDFTTMSCALIEKTAIVVNVRRKENVGESYISEAHKIMQTALTTLDGDLKNLPFKINSIKNDAVLNSITQIDTVPQSYFNIPLVVNNRLVGLIQVSSIVKNLFKEEDITLLFKIVNRASLAVARLENVIETERGKADALIFSLSSGAMLFSFTKAGVELSLINSSAREFLRLEENAETKSVFSAFGAEFDLVSKIREVISDKKSLMFKDIVFHGRHFKVYVSPVFLHETEKIIGVSVTLQDVTLEREIESLRENFTNMVVHEMRSPLTAIKGAVGLLTSKDLKKDEKEKMIGVIASSADSMLTEVSELLDSAKIDSGKFTVAKKLADINKLIEQKAGSFLPLAQEKRITISTHFEMNIPQFEFDPVRVEQVLNNLLSNSIKFSHQGAKIDLETHAKNGFLEVVARDTGIGISEEEKGRIFTKFGQFGTASRAVGTGLGLYISKGIIEAHGGTIKVESEKGEGTVVTFTLPLGFEGQHKVQSLEHQKMTIN